MNLITMDSFYQYYIKNKNTSPAQSLKKFVSNVIYPRYRNIDALNKPREFAQYNIEHTLKSNYFVPGFLYTWTYEAAKNDEDDFVIISSTTNPNAKIKISEAQKKGSPIVLCLNSDNKEYVMGLDLTLFPPEVSAIILDVIVSLDPKYFENLNYESWKENSQYLPNNLIKFFMQKGSISQFANFVKNKYSIDISKTIRNYKIKNIKNPLLVEFWAWKYVPFQVDKFYKLKLTILD